MVKRCFTISQHDITLRNKVIQYNPFHITTHTIHTQIQCTNTRCTQPAKHVYSTEHGIIGEGMEANDVYILCVECANSVYSNIIMLRFYKEILFLWKLYAARREPKQTLIISIFI